MSDLPAFETSYTTTEVNKAGSRVYDDAWRSGGVEITRRSQRFVLLRRDHLAKLIADARDDRPKSLDDLLADYDADKVKKLAADFLDQPPAGKEMI